ncbi:MAG TPA: helix-turn-helix domain-containing protein [Acidimicrobiales bacterium]
MGRRAGVTPEETRERLVDAAARVFQLKGYEGATVSLIAQEAGVTSGAIYAHYPNKAALLVDALRVNRERVLASLFPSGRARSGGAEAAPGTAHDTLLALARRLAHRDDRGTELLAEAALAARRDQELAAVLVDALEEREASLAALLRHGQDEGSLDGGFSPEAGARLALMLSLGSMLVHTLGLPVVDRGEWAEVVRRVVGGFAAPGPDAPPAPDALAQEGNQ